MTSVATPPDLTVQQTALLEHLLADPAWCARRGAPHPRIAALATPTEAHAKAWTKYVTPNELADLELLLLRAIDRAEIALGPRTTGALALAGVQPRGLRRAIDNATLSGLAAKFTADGAARLKPTAAAIALLASETVR